VNSILRILHLEDDPRDAELLQATLEAEGMDCQVTRVETEAEFRAALGGKIPFSSSSLITRFLLSMGFPV